MAKRHSQDEGGGLNQDWMVTFSDCMTLLLCFFVLLLSFSSFDEMTLARLSGRIVMKPRPSISSARTTPDRSMVRPPKSIDDLTERGSDFPSEDQLEPTRYPREPLNIQDLDAYADQRVLTIPSDRVFVARGAQLRLDIQSTLSRTAEFLRRMPEAMVVVGETCPAGAGERMIGPQPLALARSWRLIEYFTATEGLEASRFNMAPETVDAGREKPAVRLTILNSRVHP